MQRLPAPSARRRKVPGGAHARMRLGASGGSAARQGALALALELTPRRTPVPDVLAAGQRHSCRPLSSAISLGWPAGISLAARLLRIRITPQRARDALCHASRADSAPEEGARRRHGSSPPHLSPPRLSLHSSPRRAGRLSVRLHPEAAASLPPPHRRRKARSAAEQTEQPGRARLAHTRYGGSQV
jgi:hypothetical protein